MKYIILDVQGFQISDHTFSPKELAVYDGSKALHFVFMLPFPFRYVKPEFKKQAIWLIQNHNSIKWNEGILPNIKFEEILKNVTQDIDKIFVKGKEKSDFIRSCTSIKVVELEEHLKL